MQGPSSTQGAPPASQDPEPVSALESAAVSAQIAGPEPEIELPPTIEQEIGSDLDMLDHYIEHDPEGLAEAAASSASESFRRMVCDELDSNGYYELAYDLACILNEDYDTERFVQECPADALVFGTVRDDADIVASSIVYLKDMECSEDILDAYLRLTSLGSAGMQTAREMISGLEDKLYSLHLFPEIHQRAIEIGDSYTMGMMANMLRDDAPEEALLLAREAGDIALENELESEFDAAVPGLEEYSRLIATAHCLVAMVSEEFSVYLPAKIHVSSPDGSYATILIARPGVWY